MTGLASATVIGVGTCIHRNGQVKQPSFIEKVDCLFNSSEIAHHDRWSTPIPSLDSLLDYNHSHG
ncbi:hypothetical protein [Polynucleobacter necessarius]|uniref:hypothetical protein n=1 Tax=Polynucleobacter necessarius TaxID=576610 RepID=UPI000E08D1CD|nr:hypothetical protein [Polynucleobacter necessarius]HAT39433.1 hypothetical protein [Polynucleobacter sp.]